MTEAARVRQTVRRLLASTPAFAQLPPAKQQQVARDTVRVAAYMADPHGLVSREARQPLLVRGRVRPKDGVDVVLGELAAVSFPDFVGGLINGVFGAIVNASIAQMRAYADLVASVAKSVDDFVDQNITDDHARDDLASHFPDQFCTGTGAGTRPRLRWRGDAARAASAVQTAWGLRAPIADPDRLVRAARRRLAVQRQQMLATMVLLGINRIVVSDGKIAAR